MPPKASVSFGSNPDTKFGWKRTSAPIRIQTRQTQAHLSFGLVPKTNSRGGRHGYSINRLIRGQRTSAYA
jgi:hypothetical protein